MPFLISGQHSMSHSLKIWACSVPRGADILLRSGGSWDRATEQQRADAELNARDATINAVTALQPWTPTVTAQCHLAAGTWPHRRAEICVQFDWTSCRCHFTNTTFTSEQCNLEPFMCHIYQAMDAHVAHLPENFNPSCRRTTSTLCWGLEPGQESGSEGPPHYHISPGDPALSTASTSWMLRSHQLPAGLVRGCGVLKDLPA